jgi:hypothetical protein
LSIQSQFNLTIIASDAQNGSTNLQRVINNSYTGPTAYYLIPQVIGVNAPSAPGLAAGTGGSLSSATHYVKITYVNAPQGESLPSPEASVAVSASGTITVTSPAASAPATGYNVYIATSSGSETKQNTTPIAIGTNYVQTAALISGAALPGSNSTLIYTPTLPLTPVQALYTKNISTGTQNVTVTWTPNGGSSNPVLALVPGGEINFCEATVTPAVGGITALSFTASAVQAQVEFYAAA